LRKNVVAAIESLEQHVKLPSSARYGIKNQEFRSSGVAGVQEAHRSVDLDSTFKVMKKFHPTSSTCVCL
jgi:hypothetical protein